MVGHWWPAGGQCWPGFGGFWMVLVGAHFIFPLSWQVRNSTGASVVLLLSVR